MGEGLPRQAFLPQPELVVVDRAQLGPSLLGQNHVIKADAITLGIDVQLAHGIGLVAGIAKGLGQRGQRGHGRIG